MLRPFWEEFALSVAGPLLTALIATGLVGLWASRAAQRWQERREDAHLRESLIKETLEAAGAFYVALRHHDRLERMPSHSSVDITASGNALDEVYLRTRLAADAMEYRLRAWFVEEEAAQVWHSLIDLLTVPYFRQIGFANDRFLLESAGPEHSTLTIEELQDDELIYSAYKRRARSLPGTILSAHRRRY